MEINHLPPPNVAPIRAPSAVGDGDAGPNSPYYRQRKHKQQTAQNEHAEEPAPSLEGSATHIDIRV